MNRGGAYFKSFRFKGSPCKLEQSFNGGVEGRRDGGTGSPKMVNRIIGLKHIHRQHSQLLTKALWYHFNPLKMATSQKMSGQNIWERSPDSKSLPPVTGSISDIITPTSMPYGPTVLSREGETLTLYVRNFGQKRWKNLGSDTCQQVVGSIQRTNLKVENLRLLSSVLGITFVGVSPVLLKLEKYMLTEYWQTM